MLHPMGTNFTRTIWAPGLGEEVRTPPSPFTVIPVYLFFVFFFTLFHVKYFTPLHSLLQSAPPPLAQLLVPFTVIQNKIILFLIS